MEELLSLGSLWLKLRDKERVVEREDGEERPAEEKWEENEGGECGYAVI